MWSRAEEETYFLHWLYCLYATECSLTYTFAWVEVKFMVYLFKGREHTSKSGRLNDKEAPMHILLEEIQYSTIFFFMQLNTGSKLSATEDRNSNSWKRSKRTRLIHYTICWMVVRQSLLKYCCRLLYMWWKSWHVHSWNSLIFRRFLQMRGTRPQFEHCITKYSFVLHSVPLGPRLSYLFFSDLYDTAS